MQVSFPICTTQKEKDHLELIPHTGMCLRTHLNVTLGGKHVLPTMTTSIRKLPLTKFFKLNLFE